MQKFASFRDFGEHYAEMTNPDAYTAAFSAEIATSQLSIMDEPTSAEMPDAATARACVEQLTGDLFSLFAETRLEPLAARIAWGIVNSFHKVAGQLERQEDDAARELGELARIDDPSEIHAYELEEKQTLCQSLHEAMAVIECMRDHAAETYRVRTGKVWQPIRGSRTSRTLTASQIDARDLLAARQNERNAKHNPTGPVVVVSGGKSWQHYQPLWDRLDMIKKRVPNLFIATTGQQTGADNFAANWAAARGVKIVTFALDRRRGKAAPFARNDQMLSLNPIEVIVCEGSGIQANLAQKARTLGLPVKIFRNADFEHEERREAG